MNSEEILARIPKRNTGTQKHPNMYAVGVSKHGAIHFHLEIEGELYITTLRVKSTSKSKNSCILRCIQKKCLSAIGIVFPESFSGPPLDPKSYYEFLKNNPNDFNLADFKYVHFNPYKHIHTCNPKKVNALNVSEYDLYPRPVDGDDKRIKGTLTVPQFNKNQKRVDRLEYHQDAKRLRIHEEMSRGPAEEFVELTAYQVNNNDYLENQLQDRIDLAKISELPQGLEYTDKLTGRTKIPIIDPVQPRKSSLLNDDPEINDDTSLTIVVHESVKEETKIEVKEEAEPIESKIYDDHQAIKTETKQEPLSDDDDFKFHVMN